MTVGGWECVAVKPVWRLLLRDGQMMLETYQPGQVTGDWPLRTRFYLNLGRVVRRRKRPADG